MVTRILPNGMGQPLADSLAVRGPIQMSGQVWYVNSATGVDAVSPRGLTEEYPLATLAQACTNAASGDVIILMPYHTETVTAQIHIFAEFFTILGAGRSAGKPTVKLTNSFLAGPMLLFDSFQVRMRNIWFPEPTGSSTSATVQTDALMLVDGCYFECGGNNDAGGYGLLMDGTVANISNTTFVSTATVNTNRPAEGVYCSSTTQLSWRDVVFDGGPYGWDGYAASVISAPSFGFMLEGISLLRGSDLFIDSNAEGLLQTTIVTGGSRVNW